MHPACDAKTELYQDVPIEDIAGNHGVDYGFSGLVTEDGGTMIVTISETDLTGRTLWSDSFKAQMTDRYRNYKSSGSIYANSLVYLKRLDIIPLMQNAVTIRFTLTPASPKTYNILDSWLLMR